MMYYLRRIGSFLFNRTVLVLLGLVLLSLMVWYIGPIVAIGSVRPLEPELTRWLVIGVIFAVYLIRMVIRWWRQKNINGRLLSQLAKVQESRELDPKAPGAEEVVELRKRFEDAIKTLKKTSFHAAKGRNPFAFLSKQYIYQLPWYMFVGAPGSGKTTALINSGLGFPLAEQFGKTALRGVGGTRNCDWWFTNEAVLLDTAGRYTTQESDESLDKAEWEGFLGLLKKFRPRQPLNGVLLTLSVPDLLSMSEPQRDLHAAALRKRLYELRDILKIQFPVYVLVTKCDLLAGFNEFYDNLDKEERAQVWGFTFGYDENQVNPALVLKSFEPEFDRLSNRLNDGLIVRIGQEADLSKRALIYSLPQQFQGLRDVLSRTLNNIFTESKFGEQPVLRGVYFTSGAQEGAPFDRVLGALAKTFRLASSVRFNLSSQAQGRSFFIQNLLQQVIFGESHLAGRNIAWERRLTFFRRAGFASCAMLLIGSIVAWSYSYSNNKSYLADVSQKALVAETTIQATGKNPDADLVTLSALLDQVKNLPSSKAFSVESPPIDYTYGLYQGGKMDAAASGAYRRLLEDGLLTFVSRQVEAMVRSPEQANNLEAMYETLKAYLMLHEPKYYDGAFLKGFVGAQVARSMGDSLTREQRASLDAHVTALFDGRAVVSPFQKDDALIRQTRATLTTFSLAQLSYLRLKRRLDSNDLGDFTLIKAAGPQAPLVFKFGSGKPLTNGIPGLFTYRGYHELFKKEVNSVAAVLGAEEAWVLDPAGSSAKQLGEDLIKGKLAVEVTRLYLNEYGNIWDAFLKDMQLINPGSLQQSIQSARVLSAPDSPISLFVKAAVVETTLLREERSDGQSILGRAKQNVRSTKDDIERIFGAAAMPGNIQPREKLELIVDSRFESLRRLATNPSGQGPAPIDSAVLPLINELYNSLAATDASLKAGNVPPTSDVSTKMQAESARLPMPLRTMFASLASTSAAQAAGIARANLVANLDGAVGKFCRTAIAGRYPISTGSAREVTPGDFAQMFAGGALMDDFFQKNLANIVDMSTNPWTFKRGVDGAPAGGSSALLAFQRAQVIRDVFFRGGGRTPQVAFSIKVVEMDAKIDQLVLDVDGQIFKYAHGPQLAQNMIWPGTRGSNQVRLQLTPQVSGSTGAVAEGVWALHRFFDKLQITPGASAERFLATVNIDGRRAVFEVVAGSVENPFALRSLREFNCPGR
jgi:type VI secretion system protein ImpL